ncbi:hypothetical protein CEXT_562761 [Caerostris extrusa]|uniref:Uncharacterized protein n=1 Tax=Caerostris extrusa TaxID=172846 RepID=A0AAV4PRS7_CAEEX|nr:hypothetical protein CEXT_562761 [Caerostris extrusa]
MGLTEICKTSKWNPLFHLKIMICASRTIKRTRDSNPDDCDDNAIEHGMLSELHSDYKENIQLRSWKNNDLRKSNNKRTRDSNPDDCDDNAIEHGMLSELHSDYKENIQLKEKEKCEGKEEIKGPLIQN